MEDESSRTLEQVYRSAVRGLYARLRSNYDFIYRRFGAEGIKLIADMSREYGLSVAERARKRLDSTDIMSVAGYLQRIFDTVNRGTGSFPVVEEGSTRVVIRAYRCPLDLDNPEICRAHTNMEKTVVEELNSNLTYRIGKSIPAGDGYCEHIIEVKT